MHEGPPACKSIPCRPDSPSAGTQTAPNADDESAGESRDGEGSDADESQDLLGHIGEVDAEDPDPEEVMSDDVDESL